MTKYADNEGIRRRRFTVRTADLSARLHRKQKPGCDDALPWPRSIHAMWHPCAFVMGRERPAAEADKSALGALKRPLRVGHVVEVEVGDTC